MFVKDKTSQESYTHVCDGQTEKQMKKKSVEIRLHDITCFMVSRDERGVPIMEYAKYCPYCGCCLADEEIQE